MDIFSIVWQSLSITLFVLSMMLIIDYLNVFTRGIWSENLQQNKWKQVLLGALLGIIPGCLGAYTAVSLYIHNIFGLGALVAAMIATSGDEAFFMFSIIPNKAFLIVLILFFVAVVTGFLVDFLSKKKPDGRSIKHFDIHEDEPECICFDRKHLFSQLKNITRLRLTLLIILVVSIVLVMINFEDLLLGFQSHIHEGEHTDHFHPRWVAVTFSVVLGLSLFIVATVSDHFLSGHLLNHILKKHFLRIFLWTFVTLLALHFLSQYIHVEELISKNLYLVLLIAILIGIIPESGPHLIFVILFASGSIPLSILLASSIVQDGHGSLPLLAESPKSFLKVKAINILVGFLVGMAGLMMDL